MGSDTPPDEEDALDRIGEQIDRLVTVDVNTRLGITEMYEAAREQEGKPLTLAAAELIQDRAEVGGRAIIPTGEVMWQNAFESKYYTETDGPAGAALLARALYLAYGVRSILPTDPDVVRGIEAACRGAGMVPVPYDELDLADEAPVDFPAVSVVPFPEDLERAEKRAETLVDENDPFAVIPIEKDAKRHYGDYDEYMSQRRAKVEPLVERARDEDIATIAIGDGGNEIGMGNIEDVVVDLFGDKAAATETDVLVVAAISNWGASGVCALLSAVERDPEIMHTGEDEMRTLEESVRDGNFGGPTGAMLPWVDNVPGYVSSHFAEIMRVIVNRGFITGDFMYDPNRTRTIGL